MNNDTQRITEQNPDLPATRKAPRGRMIAGAFALLCCCLVVVLVPAVTLGGGVDFISEHGGIYRGLADEKVKAGALKLIKLYEPSLSGCSDVALFYGYVVTEPAFTDGPWQENWQMNLCGNLQLYSISFTPTENGATELSITRTTP